MVGSFKTASEIERFLQAWLTQYVNGNLAAAGESRARFPLVAGKVTVSELPGQAGQLRLHGAPAAALPARRHIRRLPPRHRSQRSMSAIAARVGVP